MLYVQVYYTNTGDMDGCNLIYISLCKHRMFERDLFSLNHLPLQPDKMGSTVSGFRWTEYCLSRKKGKPYFKHIRDLFIYFIRKYPVMIHYLMMDFFILSEYNCNHEFKKLVDELPVLAPAERVWFLRENAGKRFDEEDGKKC